MPTFQREQDGSLSPTTQAAINAELYRLLDEYSKEKYPSKHREHLGVSVIGAKCWRQLWYAFRWVKLEKHEPRMKRLFNRGHLEEPKFAELLGWMGFHVRIIDPETKKQYRFSAVGGHYGGSGDSVALLPWFRGMDGGERDESFRILVEYKTHNNKSFGEFKTDKTKKIKDQAKTISVKTAKPQHYTQMACYGKEFKTRYGLYLAINKDDDDIYFEFLELDWNVAILSEKKAADIIGSQIPPPRIAENEAFFDCKFCHFAGICFHNDPVEINCRSCKNAIPVEAGKWRCNLYKATIPGDFIAKGCSQHVSINS